MAKKCTKCGSSGPFHKEKRAKDGLTSQCQECINAQNKQRYYDNKERHVERVKAWQESNGDKVKSYKKKWKVNNPDKVREHNSYDRNPERAKNNSQFYRLRHREQVKETSRNYQRKTGQATKWRLSNLVRAKDSQRQWRKDNPDKVAATSNRRRARIKGNGGEFTAQEWKALCEYYDNKCLRCGRDDVKLTVDHVTPIDRGGLNDISNIQPLCLTCNSAKGTKDTDYRNRGSIMRWIQRTLL